MRFFRSLVGPLAGLALAAAAGTANAAPSGSGLGDLKGDAAATTAVEKAYWSVRCHWHRGHKVCHRVWVRPHVYVAPPYLYFGPSRHYGYRHHGYRRWR
jgi:hypothetical protein